VERIFANLYRIGAPNRRGISYTYFLVRKAGNLLVCHQSAPSAADIKQMQSLGGVDSQWICHHHDTIRDGSSHEKLHDRFGCVLHHHKTDRTGVRKRAKCPAEQFGDDGCQYGDDFEAMFFPTCTAGHSVFRWRSRGKYYLFSSHAIYMRDSKWDLHFNEHRVSQWSPRREQLGKLRLDYVFPGYSSPEDSGFYRLNDQTRRSFARALKAAA
jgi:hypothetical protein